MRKKQQLFIAVLIAIVFFAFIPHAYATAGGFHGDGGFHGGGGYHGGGHYSSGSSGRTTFWDFIWIPIISLYLLFGVVSVKFSSKYKRGDTLGNRELSSKIKNNFLEIQKAWDKENLISVLGLYDNKLFTKHTEILETYSRKGQVNHTKEVNVVGLNRYKKLGNSKFSVDISFTAIDFVLDKRTNKIITGGRNNRRFLQRWTFTDDGYNIKVCKIKEFKV
ncbi:hypothetical protein BW152_10270 [Lactococcus lactis]|uniref:hypothetical protein n=1 Tax=Lactococcus lactis TaxID=1358 RepID=UPI000BF97015|nr:hypothetical protein [Lactococcus lactis]PFG80296.1 hypothetical protein BW152_10270 [Lactococcus lactis]